MAYKFNGGRGAVICDKCNTMFDAGISWYEYLQIYVHMNDDDICWKCQPQNKNKKPNNKMVFGKYKCANNNKTVC